jgi:8-oxo-dGTP pyrophosphatase MutT (NUDIX family)
MKTTAGIFLINKKNEILIGHPTHHPEKFWSIPKGEFEYPNDPFREALRELDEETNVLLQNNIKYHTLDPKVYKSNKKILYSFVIFESENKFDLEKFDLKCNSFFKYKNKMLPEFDKVKWTNIKKAIDLVHESQKDQLIHIYSSFRS